MKKVGVIGAGWLGKDLVKQLSADKEIVIVSTNRSEQPGEFHNQFQFEFGNDLPHAFVDELDLLFITATLPKENSLQLTEFVNQLQEKLSWQCRVVFTSTIGVYASDQGVVDEASKALNTDSVYYQMEQELLTKFPGRVTILRLGGLIGADRHPVFSLAGRKKIPDGQKPVNLVHKQDILNCMQLLLHDETASGVYNLVYPDHPSKERYYTQKAIERELPLPEFETGTNAGKIVDATRSCQVHGFNYQFSI